MRPGLRLSLLLLVSLIGAGGLALIVGLALGAAEQDAVDAARARVDRGLTSVRRIMDDRLLRLADQAQLLATQPALVEAFLNRDQAALSDLLAQARSQFGTTTAAAVVDEKMRSVADHPTRAPYDYSQLSIVRAFFTANQPAVIRPRYGIEARPTASNPLNDLGLAAAYPIISAGQHVGAVVLLQQFNDPLMQQLANATGLHVAVLTADTLIAGSKEVRDLFVAPRVRPPGQKLAPVEPRHRIGDVTFIATSEALRGWLPVSSLARPIPTPAGGLPGRERTAPGGGAQGAPVVATLFVGMKESDALAGVASLRGQLLLAGAGIWCAAILGALALAGQLRDPLDRTAEALAALADGRASPAPPRGLLRETATLAGAAATAIQASTERLQALRDEVRKLAAVMDSVTEGILVLDDRARLVTINETAARLLGLPDGLPPGTELAAMLTPGQWQALQPIVLRRDRVTREINLDEPRQAIVRVAAVPVHDDNARPLGRAIVLQDVTEERLLDNVKADFFTAMSHELRTPLSAIKGAAEVLLDDELPPAQERFVQTIHRNADRLSRLVTDLLDLSKLESGRIELRLARVDLNEIVADVLAALQPVADREGQRLLNRTSGEALPLIADHERVEQIITNLVSNAIQYTPEGGEIAVRTWREGGDVYLAVTDNGVGISTVDLQHLFDKFYQGVNALTHKRGGSGLGLTIVKYLAELHGGSVSVQSKLGAGSTFTIRLPVSPPADGRAEPRAAPPALAQAPLALPAGDQADSEEALR
jgi:two-component system phosphate regulon sensor histidine kinase PhoR